MVGTSEAGAVAAPKGQARTPYSQGQASQKPSKTGEAAAEAAGAKAEASGPVPSLPLSSKARRVPRAMTCVACKRAKTPCGGAYPCARCFKKGLQCVMPARYHKSRPKGDPEVAAREAAELASPVLIELAFERFEAMGVAESMATAFIQLMAEGVIIRPTVVMGLAFWKLRSVVCGVDVTCGGAGHIAKYADPPITALELEGPGFALDMPEAAIRPMLVADVERLRASIDTFKASETFVRLDDDPQNKAIFASVFDSQGQLFEAGNALFEETFLSSHNFLEESLANRVINTVLFSALIAPEDRVLWYRAAFLVCFTATQRVVEFVKIFDREGDINLYIMEVSKATLPGSNAIIGGIVTRLQPTPTSRHLSARPSLHHRVQVFRSHPAAKAANGKCPATIPELDEAEAAAAATLPAMATLPLPLAPQGGHAAGAEAYAFGSGVQALFGPPNLSKAQVPPLLSPVTGSGHGPKEVDERSPTSDSSSPFFTPLSVAEHPDDNSGGGGMIPPKRLLPGPDVAAGAGAGAAEVSHLAPDEQWLQDPLLPGALPLLGGGEQSGLGSQGSNPFGSAEEAAMWHDVLQFYLGEEDEAAGALGATAATAAARAEEAEPGFGWEH